LLLFVIDDGHWQALGWLSGRHGLVALAPALLGVAAHLRWREDGWRWGLPLSLVGYAVGLLGGEMALQALAYVAAYELLHKDSLWQRIKSLAPAAVLVFLYLLLYRSLGYGAHLH